MGRLGDADVHAAFVEFKAKDTDKCLSAQCIYCQSVRAKNTSRQRAHLLECRPYLDAMKEHNPNSSILEMATNGTSASTPTPSKPSAASKKRDADTMLAANTTGYTGETVAAHLPPVPKPVLVRDLQLIIQLNPRIEIGHSGHGARSWVSFISGHWSANWGKGTLVPGGQAKQLISQDLSTNVDANFLLQTHDQPAAYITVHTSGWRVGPRDILERLMDPSQTDGIDPKLYTYRLNLQMETGSPKYLHLNTGMWVASGLQRASEIVFDVYRIT